MPTESLSNDYGPPMLDFRILGPLEVGGEQGPLRLGGPKQRATLAILLLNANRVVSVDRLADELYAGAAPISAVTQVQRQISDLRKTLGSASVIETRAPGYVIRLAAGQLDLERFERLTGEASQALARGEPDQAADLLREALGLWRGAPLDDFAYESFAQAAIERLEEIRLAALEQRIEAELALGRHLELVGELEGLTAAHPLRERFCEQLVLALYRSDRQVDALEVYRRARDTLAGEFGLEPATALRELERAILTHDSSLDLARPVRGSTGTPEPAHTLLAAAQTGRLDGLCSLAELLVRLPGGEVILTHLLADGSELGDAATALNDRQRDRSTAPFVRRPSRPSNPRATSSASHPTTTSSSCSSTPHPALAARSSPRTWPRSSSDRRPTWEWSRERRSTGSSATGCSSRLRVASTTGRHSSSECGSPWPEQFP